MNSNFTFLYLFLECMRCGMAFFFLIPKGPLCICVNSISIYMYKGDLGNMLTFAFILILRPNFH